MEPSRPGLALFDFDGTITTRDTMFAFVLHCRGPLRTALGLVWVSPWLVGHALGLVPNHVAKTRLLRHFLAGASRREIEAWSASFADAVDEMVRPGAEERLRWHRAQGHDVVLVSASLDLWVRPWAERRGVKVLCTEARFDGDRFSGELATPNCHGPEKEVRIRAAIHLEQYARIWGYGDSSGDAEMLALAHESSFRPFRSPPAG